MYGYILLLGAFMEFIVVIFALYYFAMEDMQGSLLTFVCFIVVLIVTILVAWASKKASNKKK